MHTTENDWRKKESAVFDQKVKPLSFGIDKYILYKFK